MYQKLLAGDESVINPISDSWMIKVLETARKLAVTSEGFEDVIQEGNMALFLKLTELCGCEEKTDVEAELQGAVETAMKSSILAEEGEDEDEKAMVGKLALVNEAKKYLAEENGREATVQELAAYTQLTEEELSDILLSDPESGSEGRMAYRIQNQYWSGLFWSKRLYFSPHD